MKKHTIPMFVAAALSAATVSQATLFSSTFDDATSANDFVVAQVAGSNDVITFGFDYGALGIPEAPSSPIGAAATRGLFLQANRAAPGVINGINILAANNGVLLNFTQNIDVTFDLWMGVGTDLAAGTEIALFGINKTDSNSVNRRTGATQTGADGVWFHASGDGGFGSTSTVANSRDVVAYINNDVAGRLDNLQEPLASLFPAQGNLPAGALGNRWVTVRIQEIGNEVSMSFNGTEIFRFENTGPTAGTVFLGYQDPFSGSIPSDTDNFFAVYDNLNVVPEPGTLAALGIGALALLRRKRNRS